MWCESCFQKGDDTRTDDETEAEGDETRSVRPETRPEGCSTRLNVVSLTKVTDLRDRAIYLPANRTRE